jgi:CarD family transcriptional regulator, regulator of rRNA transcription
MTLKVGNKVVYPSQGPCLIGGVVKKIVGGTPMRFYQLAVLAENGGNLFVPIDKVAAMGIRQLLEESEIPKLLGRLKKATAAATNWRQRTMNNVKLLHSGSAFDLAELVESLTAANATKILSPQERQMLDRARKILICEIAEVTGETKNAAEERLDQALQIAHTQ